MLAERIENERIDWILDKIGVRCRDLGNGWSLERSIRPMLLVRGSLRDPSANQFDIRFSELLVELARWHPFVIICGQRDAAEQFRVLGRPGNNRLAVQGLIANIESQIGFACFLVGAVTSETLVRQQRANLVRERYRCRCGRFNGFVSPQRGGKHADQTAEHQSRSNKDLHGSVTVVHCLASKRFPELRSPCGTDVSGNGSLLPHDRRQTVRSCYRVPAADSTEWNRFPMAMSCACR